MLIDINIIKFEVILFDVIYKKIIIDSCKVTISLFVILKRERVERKLRSRKQITISTHTIITILIKCRQKIILNNKNYSFLLRSNIVLESNNSFFAYIVNANIKAI